MLPTRSPRVPPQTLFGPEGREDREVLDPNNDLKRHVRSGPRPQQLPLSCDGTVNCRLSTADLLVLLFSEPVLLELAIQGRTTDAELARHIREIASVASKGLFDRRLLEFVEAHGDRDWR